jgi:ASTRA-associated protein 1
MCLRGTKSDEDDTQLLLVAGYESGHACLYTVSQSSWSTLYSFRSHSQPVLSIVINPSKEYFYTSSADANVVQHSTALSSQPIKTFNTKHSGQTSLSVRQDGRLLVSAGWDGCGRVYSATTLKQVAVLKWHTGGLQVSTFSGGNVAKDWILLGGKDGKITLWDVFN